VTLEDDWQRWRERFDKTHNGVLWLFHNRSIWRTIMAMLDANPAVARGDHAEFWLRTCYTDSQLIGIRRETDGDSNGTGMMRSLNSLASTPRMATREWYEEQIRQLGYMGADFREGAAVFNRFADPGEPFINRARVRQDIAELKAVIDRVNTFTTKTRAHRDARINPAVPPLLPITWIDLDTAIDAVGWIIKKYYSLCHPGESLSLLTPLKTPLWTQMFQAAWMPPGFALPGVLDNDSDLPRSWFPGAEGADGPIRTRARPGSRTT
jgi:hypothetical protein